MSNEEKILEMLTAMQSQMEDVSRRLGNVEEKLDDLIEEHSMTREGVNKLLSWADTAGYIIRFPLDKAN